MVNNTRKEPQSAPQFTHPKNHGIPHPQEPKRHKNSRNSQFKTEQTILIDKAQQVRGQRELEAHAGQDT
jgi:hypothetical protein